MSLGDFLVLWSLIFGISSVFLSVIWMGIQVEANSSCVKTISFPMGLLGLNFLFALASWYITAGPK